MTWGLHRNIVLLYYFIQGEAVCIVIFIITFLLFRDGGGHDMKTPVRALYSRSADP